jgi:CelD/BcsL family acetyltransferase involved in cellulose biosynthesis
MPRATTAAAIPGVAEVAIFRIFAPIEAEWRSFEATAAGHVFQTFAFVSAWAGTVGRERGVEPLIVVGRDASGQTLFILPFGVSRRLGSRQLEWLGGEHADYKCGLYDVAFLGRTSRSIFAAAVVAMLKDEADLCNFSRQPAFIDGLANPFASFSALKHCDSSHETRLAASWDDYYRAKRNSSSRRHDRSKFKRLEELGEARVKTELTPAEIQRAMAVLFAEKERSLGERGAGGFFSSKAVQEFYGGLARLPHPSGPCHVAALEVAGEIVAVNWGLVRGNRYYYVMHAFSADGPAAKSSPGRLLMYGLMQWCIERGIDIFDFTIGDEGFKEQWCESTLPLTDSVASLNGRGAAVALAVRTGKAAKRFIKKRPALRGVAEEIRRRLPPPRPRPAPPVAS